MTSELRAYWRIALGCFIGLMVGASPAYFNELGLFLKSYVATYGWTRGEASAGQMVALLTAGLVTPVSGALADRYGSRRVIIVGCVLLPLALLAYAIVPINYPTYLGLAVVAGLACGVVSAASYLTLPPQYFSKALGMGIALAILGLSFGSILMPLITQRLIAHYGVQGAWECLALLVAVIGIPNAVVLLRDNPAYQRQRDEGRRQDIPGLPFADAMHDLHYWVLNLTFLLIIMATSGAVLHLPSLLSDRGYSAGSTAVAVSLIGAGSLVGRFATGAMLDRMPPSIPPLIFFSGQCVGLTLLASGAGGPAPLVAALLIGGSLGAEGDMIPYIIKRLFGLRAFGQIYGVSFALYQIGAAVGGVAMGAAFDVVGSYTTALLALAAMSFVAMLMLTIVLRIRLPTPISDSAQPTVGRAGC